MRMPVCRTIWFARGLWLVAAVLAIALGVAPGVSAQDGRSEEWIRRLDANGNGMIDPDETRGRSGFFVQRAARDAGLDPDRPIAVDELTRAMRERMGSGGRGEEGGRERGRGPGGPGGGPGGGFDWGRREGGPGGDPRWGGGGSPPSGTSSGAVPGFGPDPNAPKLAPPRPFDGTPVGGKLEDRFDERIIRQVDDEILGKYDRNKNGQIDPDEWGSVTWSDDPKQDDKNGDGRLTREELAGRMARRWGNEKDRQRTPGGGDAKGDDRTRKFAESMLKQYDANKNGQLEPDEWKNMRGEPAQGDTNRDGIITLDELTARMATLSRGGPGGPWGGGPGGGGGPPPGDFSGGGGDRDRDRDREKDRDKWRSEGKASSLVTSPDGRKSYRFLSPSERLPKNVPSWLTRFDVDRDGQVFLHEFATQPNESQLAEFAQYDLNHDGVVTAIECIKAEKIGTSLSSSSYSSSSSSPWSRKDKDKEKEKDKDR